MIMLFCIAAFIRLYEATFEDKWLTKASQLFDYTIRNFKDEESGMFFFTSEKDQPLIARKMEILIYPLPPVPKWQKMLLYWVAI